jgi:DNA-binding NarL/FixJ family response regulator
MNPTRILLADDHVMLLDILKDFLAPEFDVVGVAHDGRSMVDMAKLYHPEIIVADIAMPQLNGIDAVRMIRKESIESKILFLTSYDDLPLVEEAFQAGASGYVLKLGSAEELVQAIHCVERGGTYVTPLLAGDLVSSLLTSAPGHNSSGKAALSTRQREVLRFLAEGKTMKEVANLLNISTRTVETHKYEIMKHLGVKTTAELVQYAVRIRLV